MRRLGRRTGSAACGVGRLVPIVLVAVACGGAAASEKPSSKSTPDAAVQAYKLGPGAYEVGVVEEIVLADARRNKKLSVKIYYPKAQGPFPVIIFSHGGGGSKDGYGYLARFWASHGYVCIHPTHADSVRLRRQAGEKVQGLRDIVRQALTDTNGWLNRPKDISFIIDSLGEIERKNAALRGKPDGKHIGVGGHSFGAYTSQVVGGATINLPDGRRGLSLADRRVQAVVVLSPQGIGQMGLHRHSWDTFTTPMMSVTGTHDRGAKGQDPAWRLDPFKYSPPGDKYHVFIDDAHHFSFAGQLADGTRPGGGALFTLMLRRRAQLASQQRENQIQDYVKIATIAFWDAYLEGDTRAKAYLESDALTKYAKGTVTIDRK